MLNSQILSAMADTGRRLNASYRNGVIASIGKPIEYENLQPGEYTVLAVVFSKGKQRLALVESKHLIPPNDTVFFIKNLPDQELEPGWNFYIERKE
jgi:hypothetical protein